MNMTPIHVDRLSSALAEAGVHLKRSKILQIAASAFGCRNVHELASHDEKGDLEAAKPQCLGVQHVIHIGPMVFFRDPSGYSYAIDARHEALQTGRAGRYHLAPYGGLSRYDGQDRTIEGAKNIPDADPEIPYLLTDSDLEHVNGAEMDRQMLGTVFGTFENDFYPLDEREQAYVDDDTLVSDDRLYEARMGYSAMYRGAKHFAPTVEFPWGESVGCEHAEAVSQARSYAAILSTRAAALGGNALVQENAIDAYGAPAVLVRVLVPITSAMKVSPEEWRRWLGMTLSEGKTEDLRAEGSEFAVTLEHIGEGYDGEYDPSDPEDRRLYRFSVDRKVDGAWHEEPDASYCTSIPLDVGIDRARCVVEYLLAQIEGASGSRIKRLCERLSWLTIDDVEMDLNGFPSGTTH